MSRVNPKDVPIVRTTTKQTWGKPMLSSKKTIQGLGLLAMTGLIGFSAMKGIAQSNSTLSPRNIAAASNTFQQPEDRFALALHLANTSSRINVRSGPGTNFSVKHYGLSGDAVTGLNQRPGKDGYEWFFIEFNQSGAQGWVREDLLVRDKSYEVSLGGLPPEAEETSYEKELHEDVSIESDSSLLNHIRNHDQLLIQGQGYLNAPDYSAQINIRRGPGTVNKVQHVGYSGDFVKVLDLDFSQDQDDAIWYYVRFSQSGAEGWVREDLLATS